MGRIAVPATEHEYAEAHEANPQPVVRKPPRLSNRRGRYVTAEWYNPLWDLGSRNETATMEDLYALGFDVNDDGIDRWADGCEPMLIPARHRNRDEWEAIAELPPMPELEPLPDDVYSWVLDKAEVLRLAKQELTGAGTWVRGSTQLRRHLGWTSMQLTAALNGVPVSTGTAQHIADLLSTTVPAIASPKEWDAATG